MATAATIATGFERTAVTLRRPKLVGINHVAIEVGDIEAALDYKAPLLKSLEAMNKAALEFYGRIFDFTLRGRAPGQAFIDLGDQFLAMMEVAGTTTGTPQRHFGLVVEDRDAVRALVAAAGGTILPGGFLDFLDPWGNRIEIVDYRKVQFTKAAAVLEAMGIADGKTDKAKRQLRDKGMGGAEG